MAAGSQPARPGTAPQERLRPLPHLPRGGAGHRGRLALGDTVILATTNKLTVMALWQQGYRVDS